MLACYSLLFRPNRLFIIFSDYFLFKDDISLSSKIKPTDEVWGLCANLKARGAEGEQEGFAIIIRGSNMKFFDLG